MENLERDWMSSKTMELPMALEAGDAAYVSRVEVYQDSSCLIDEEFHKNYISIGRSTKSDIVLPDVRISRHHFYLYTDSYQIFVFVKPGKQPLSINGQPVNAAALGTGDTIEIGPYTLKIQISFDEDPPQIEEDLRYQVVFEGKIKNDFTRSQVAKSLKHRLKINGQQTASLFSGKSIVVGRDLDLPEAIRFKNEFEKSGAVGQVQAVINSTEPDEKPLNHMSVVHRPDRIEEKPKNGVSAAHRSGRTDKKPQSQASETQPSDRTDEPPKSEASVVHLSSRTGEKPKNGQSASHLEIKGLTLPDSAFPLIQATAADEVDEDEEEDDSAASFSLKEKLSTIGASDRRLPGRAQRPARSVGVYKFRGDAVIDVCYLDSRQSYHINSSRGRFRLAQKNGSEKGYLYFNKNFTGTVRTKESGAVPISDFLTDDHLYHKRKRIFRLPIPDPGEVFVNDGCYDYLIRPIFPSQSPAVPEPRQAKELSWKHGAFSLLAHMIFLVILTLLPTSVLKNTPEPETRFVKVDPHILEQIQPKPKPVIKPPPTKPLETKPAPKPVEKKAPVQKKPVVKKKAVAKKKPVKKSLKSTSHKAASKTGKKTRKAAVSRDPNAGGGFGKGNTSKRNVKQVGVLGMLGDGKASKVQPAIADVTNLDAVRSNNSGQAKFKVGGIKGKLGTSEISVTGGDVVATKGNSQVLRSYGAGGSGRVAALQKGSVGQKQVKGMVQASLSKSVRIRGGMSREAVKRVIQQHLDEITYCYETALIANPSIKGKITMEWKILMSGAVGEVRIKSSTVKSPEIYGCIKSAIKTWRFPEPVGNEVVVSYPFIFDVVGF